MTAQAVARPRDSGNESKFLAALGITESKLKIKNVFKNQICIAQIPKNVSLK
ncbi:MAG: hypothetical protein O9311_04900 [Cytophagales bacterium]|nr:hypothetical protein [Cytophagales bacterium]